MSAFSLVFKCQMVFSGRVLSYTFLVKKNGLEINITVFKTVATSQTLKSTI